MTDKRRSSFNKWGWLFALGTGLVAAAPLFLSSGFLNTRGAGESPYLLIRLHQLYTALRGGAFPVRWMPDAAFGLGYPFFSYYAALPYYVAALFKAFGLSYVASLKITHLLGFLVAASGMYGWVRATTRSRAGGLLAAAAYSFAPYHLVDVYLRGDMLSEFWAMAWLPWILLALHRAARRPTVRRIALVGLSYGALVATHNISALIMSPFIAAYALIVGVTQHDAEMPAWKRLGGLALGGLLGLALSAWVWLPALAEQSAVQLGVQTTGFFDYAAHFRAADLVQPQVFFDYDPLSPTSSAFALGLVQAILMGGGVLAILYRAVRDRRSGREGFILLGLALSVGMITPLSGPVWQHVPLLPLAQFPWRFLGLASFFGAAAVGALADVIRPAIPSRRIAAGLAVLGIAGLAVTSLARLPLDFIAITDADVTAQRLGWYEAFTGDIGTTIRAEYLPAAASPRPCTSDLLLGRPPRARFLNGSGSAERLSTSARTQHWQVNAEAESLVAFPLHFWPGWRARVDGQPVSTGAVDGSGWVQVPVPEGSHSITLHLGPTPLRRAADLATLAAVLLVIGLWRPVPPRLNWLEWGLVGGGVLTVVVASMVLHSLPARPIDSPLTADFDRAPYFHHSGATLRLADGSTVSVSDAPAVLAPPPPLEAQGAPLATDPAHSPPGLYFPRLLTGSAALSGSGDPRGPVYLAPQVVMPADSTPPLDALPLDVNFGIARLLAAGSETQPGELDVRLWWQAVREASQNYMVALRVRDAGGQDWAALDVQAGGAGLYPTGLWQPGEIIPDGYRLAMPPGVPPGDMTLTVALYDRRTFEAVGETRIDGLRYDYLTPRPCGPLPDIQIDKALGIDGLDLPGSVEGAAPLAVNVEWAVLSQPRHEYHLRWQFAAEDGTGWEEQTPLAIGSDPAGWQPGACGASVLGRYALAFPPEAPSGDYGVTVVVQDEAGNSLGAPVEVGQLAYRAAARVFESPPIEKPFAVDFGGVLALEGYGLRREAGSLHLDVVWHALADPPRDYKSFVHVYDPATGEIVAQVDSMPRNYTYPTTQWAAGEFVAETLALDLSEVPSATYRLGIGWYDPETGDRLAASGPGGTHWPDDRVVLDEDIIIP